jgi:hypothetical protein
LMRMLHGTSRAPTFLMRSDASVRRS